MQSPKLAGLARLHSAIAVNDETKVQEVYDLAASRYLDTRALGASFQAQQRLVREWMPQSSGYVLEVGVGTGDMCIALAHCYEAFVGLDLSVEMVRISRRRLADVARTWFLQANGIAVPFAKGTFDVAICMGVLEYVSQPALMMQEFHRVLLPGGRLLITYPHSNCIAKVVGDAMRRYYVRAKGVTCSGSGDSVGSLVHRHCERQITALLTDTGFCVVGSRFCGARLIPWPIDELLPNMARLINEWCETHGAITRRKSIGAMHVVVAERR